MPRHVLPLSETKIHRANYRPGGRNRLYDGRGLYIELQPSGSKLWRQKYKYEGREKLLSHGAFPVVALADARVAAEAARALLDRGIDPSAHRKALGPARTITGNSFEEVAREWLAKFSKRWNESYTRTVRERLEKHIFPWLGPLPIHAITPDVVLSVLQRMEDSGILETAHRVHRYISNIYAYAIASGRAQSDPSEPLRGAIPPPPDNHYPAIVEPGKMGELLRAMANYQGAYVTRCALMLAPLFFVRPGELRQAQWVEFDLPAGEWRIPAERLKLGKAEKQRAPAHIVPLARQAIAILDELRPLTGTGRFVFPGARDENRPMSNATLNAALRRLGFDKSEMVAHGFRHMASTCLNERGYSPGAIERQLAHKAAGVRGIYNRAQLLPERRRMMQEWADYLDALRFNLPVPVPAESAALGSPSARPGDSAPAITAVAVLPGLRLALTFADGAAVMVGMAQVIADHPALVPLAAPELFAAAALSSGGDAVIWPAPEPIVLAAGRLRAWGQA